MNPVVCIIIIVVAVILVAIGLGIYGLYIIAKGDG